MAEIPETMRSERVCDMELLPSPTLSSCPHLLLRARTTTPFVLPSLVDADGADHSSRSGRNIPRSSRSITGTPSASFALTPCSFFLTLVRFTESLLSSARILENSRSTPKNSSPTETERLPVSTRCESLGKRTLLVLGGCRRSLDPNSFSPPICSSICRYSLALG